MYHGIPFEPAGFRAQAWIMTVAIRHIYISPGHNFFGHHEKPAGDHPMIEVESVRCLAGRGLDGDRFLDFKPDYKGQVTFLALETYRRLCTQFGVENKSPAVFRRNIITEGLDLNALIGTEFELQGVRFLGTQESTPCHWMNEAFAPGAEEAMRGHGGLRAKILTDGVLRAER
jgi:MOSC domain-containing protein YiiM